MSTALTVHTTQARGLAIHDGPSVLGEKSVRLPTCGAIRPGIMRLVKEFESKEATAAYARAAASGVSWDKVEEEVRRAIGLSREQRKSSILTPQNTPYFVLRKGDFTMPEIAARILDLYGEDRGQGRQLYRFPVVFLIDSWLTVLPHEFGVYRGKQKVFWSKYGDDGVRYCMTQGKAEYDEKAKRYHRPFGGVQPQLRDWNDGKCAPDDCPEYQAGQCKMRGRLHFCIPGVPGGMLWMPTTSFYGLDQMRSQMLTMLHTRGRMTSRANEPPMFYLTKREAEVSNLDLKTGERKRVKQLLPWLELGVDFTQLLEAPEPADVVEHATGVLQGEVTQQFDDDIPGEARGLDPREDIIDVEDEDDGPTVAELQTAIRQRVTRGLGIQWETFKPYALEKWGDGWRDDVKRLAAIRDEVESVTVDTLDEYRLTIIKGGEF